MFTAALPCSEITFATAWGSADEESAAALEILELAPSTSTPLASRPGGPALVFLEPAQPLLANVLERRGPFARVEISDVNAITGWVSTEHARKHTPAVEEGGYGFGRSGESMRSVRCPHDVPIYVDTSVKVHRVGRFKPNAIIEYEGPSVDDPGVTAEHHAVPIDLGGGESKPYVERTDLASCTSSPGR